MKEGVILFDANGLIFMANPIARTTWALPEGIKRPHGR